MKDTVRSPVRIVMQLRPRFIIACLVASMAASDLHAKEAFITTGQAAAQIDLLLSQEWQKQKVQANPALSDEGFVRRIYLDTVGRIPTYAETQSFLNDTATTKRALLIDRLLASEGYVQHMFHYWADILRASTRGAGGVGLMTAQRYMDYLKDSLRSNKPYDQLVHELISAEGKVWENPAIGYYMRDIGMPLDNLANTSRIFLGTRIECAQCHNDPFDKWTQKQFYQMAAFTYGIETNHAGIGQMDDALKLRSRDEQARNKVINKGTPEERTKAEAQATEARWVGKALDDLGDWVRYAKIEYLPRRQLRLPHDYKYDGDAPKSLVEPATMMGAPVATKASENPQKAYANWLTSPNNPRFTTVIANRLWKKAFGLGLIEPVDQMRDDTVASNPALMKYLEQIMISQRYDMKAMLRVLYNTQAYQREASHEEVLPGQSYHFTGPILRRMTAEQLWDSFVTLIHPTPDLPRSHIPTDAAASREARVHKVSDALDLLTSEELFEGAMKSSRAYESISSRAKALRIEYEAALKAKDKPRISALGDEIRDLEYKARSSVNDHLVVPSVARLYQKVTGSPAPAEVQAASLTLAKTAGSSADTMMASSGKPRNAKEHQYISIPGYEPTGEAAKDEAVCEAARLALFKAEASRLTIPSADLDRYLAARQAQFKEWPRAADIESPANMGHYLREFGQSDRNMIENANADASIPQSLVLMNSKLLPAILQPYSQLRLSLQSPAPPITTAYLTLLSRHPTAAEQKAWQTANQQGLDQIEDLIHALLNTREFIFVR